MEATIKPRNTSHWGTKLKFTKYTDDIKRVQNENNEPTTIYVRQIIILMRVTVIGNHILTPSSGSVLILSREIKHILISMDLKLMYFGS